ncbi:MAG: metallopeptidase family protein [Defluviitaleaceae bacterium]|nr:metallopeptidase family protein [Defluviitaleaceae bacterium]
MITTVTFEEVGAMLDEIAAGLPKEFYRDLNGGVNLIEDVKLHPESRDPQSLYIVGEYHHEPMGLGRYITIYYGSFIRLYGYFSQPMQREELKKVLVHEFTHHLESLAGERGLEIKDAQQMAKYRQRFKHE